MDTLDAFKTELEKYQKMAEKAADDELSKLRSKADKKIRNVEKRLTNLEEDSKGFQENIVEESSVMDKYSHKIFELIQNTLKNIIRPEKITFRSLTTYVESIRRGLVEQDKDLIKYVRLLKDSKYKGRVNSASKALKSLNKDLSSLEDFVKSEYGPASNIEGASDDIETLYTLFDDYERQYQELLTHEEEVKQKLEELEEHQAEVENLVNHPTKKEYEQARDTYETVQREIDYAFSNIRKVFRKYDRYTSKNRKQVDTTLLSELVTDAANALAHQSGVMGVENLLREIDATLDDTALNLARDKRETAKEDIEKFLGGQLKQYYDKASSVVGQKEKLEQELRDLQLEQKINIAQRDLAASQRDTKRIYQRNLRALTDTKDNVSKLMTEVNSKLTKISTGEVNLNFEFPELPEWIEIEE